MLAYTRMPAEGKCNIVRFRFIQKVKITGFVNGLYVGCENKVKGDFMFC